MKKLLASLCIMVAAVAHAAPAQIISRSAPVQYQLPPALTNALAAVVNRPICERAVMQDGRIVETWREGARVWTVTNTPAPVTGDKLKSTFLERMQKVEEEREKWRAAWTNSQIIVAIETARAERAERRFNTATNRLTIAINEAKLPTTKLLLQAILDAILKASEAGGND